MARNLKTLRKTKVFCGNGGLKVTKIEEILIKPEENEAFGSPHFRPLEAPGCPILMRAPPPLLSEPRIWKFPKRSTPPLTSAGPKTIETERRGGVASLPVVYIYKYGT